MAPNGLRSQALELLLTQVRAGKMTEKDARKLFDPITETKVRLLGDRMSRRTAWDLAREHDWPTLRHAEYLAVTRLQADALVSVDPELVAVADGVVPLAPLDALSVALTRGSGDLEPVVVHDLGPRAREVADELLAGVGARVDLGEGPQLRVRAEHQVDGGRRPRHVTGRQVADLVHVLRRLRRLPLRTPGQQVDEEVGGRGTRPGR